MFALERNRRVADILHLNKVTRAAKFMLTFVEILTIRTYTPRTSAKHSLHSWFLSWHFWSSLSITEVSSVSCEYRWVLGTGTLTSGRHSTTLSAIAQRILPFYTQGVGYITHFMEWLRWRRVCVCTEERRAVQWHLNRSSWSDTNSPGGYVDWNWSRFVELQVCPHTTWSVDRAILFPWSRLTITESSPYFKMKGFKSAWFPKLWRCTRTKVQ